MAECVITEAYGDDEDDEAGTGTWWVCEVINRQTVEPPFYQVPVEPPFYPTNSDIHPGQFTIDDYINPNVVE